MAKTITEAERKKFRRAKLQARKRLNAMLAAGEITGPEFNRRVSALGKLKVGQAIPASITKPSKPSAAAASTAGDKKPRMTLPVAPPPRPKKKKNDGDASMPKTLPKPKPKRPPKDDEPKYHQIDVKTGKPDFDKPKVSAAVRLRQEDKYKTFSLIEKAARQSMSRKKNKGNNDFRKGGMVLQTKDNRRSK